MTKVLAYQCFLAKIKLPQDFLWELDLEQGTGIEPAFTAWEAVVLPIYEPCEYGYYSRGLLQKQGKNREFSEISFSVYALFIKEKYDIVEYYKMEESANSDF